MPGVPRHRKVLGETIRRYREGREYSQEKLAERAELHRNYIGEVERGEKTISIDSLFRIAQALKVSLADLVAGV